MSISLYQCSVLAYLQTLGAVHGFLQRGQDHCRENGIDPQEIASSRVHPDMLPFSYQVHAVAHHACATMDAIRHGVFRPPMKNPDCSYDDLLELIASAINALQELTADEVNERQGARVMFEMGDLRLPFTAEDFVLSFSLPNFHFHATTTYDILRSKGVALGKRDYLGRLRLDK